MPERMQKRHTATPAAIHDAFVDMICHGKSDEINVKTLAEQAGIHRKTFYLHYTCIEALYEDELQKLAEEYAHLVDQLPLPYNYYDLTKVLFDFYTATPFAELLYCDPKYHEFSNKLQLMTLQHNRSKLNPYSEYSQEMQNIINAFVANASSYAFRQWIADGKKIPKNDAVEIISKLLESGVSSITKNSIRISAPDLQADSD